MGGARKGAVGEGGAGRSEGPVQRARRGGGRRGAATMPSLIPPPPSPKARPPPAPRPQRTEMTGFALRHARLTADELEKQVMREMVLPAAPGGPSYATMTESWSGTDTCVVGWKEEEGRG